MRPESERNFFRDKLNLEFPLGEAEIDIERFMDEGARGYLNLVSKLHEKGK